MSRTIEHFIWGYQDHFRVGQECGARRIFELLDERFRPEVFLVGILVEGREKSSPACVEPERDFWAKSEAFDSTLALADQIRQEYPERKLMHSHPSAQQWHDESLWRRSVRDAIQQIIEANPGRASELSYFVAHPAKVEGYLVSVVLGLQTVILKQHPSLKKGSVPIHEYRSMTLPTSLIDAVTKAYLDKASGELLLPDPGFSGTSESNAEEIVRNGANLLMAGLSYRAHPNCLVERSEFLSSCTNIACAYYEGVVGIGTMILGSEDHVSLEKVVRFEAPPKLRVTRSARKLLQLASQDLALHTNSEDVYGLVRIKQYDAFGEDVFKVRFLGHHHWQVLHEDQILMGVKYGQPYLPRPPFDEDKLRKDLPRIFRRMTEKHIGRLLALVREAEKEKFGTMLVISEGAKRESERLATQGTSISPKTLTPELLRNLTPIDGAVLLNPKGTCYAIGVILDGMSSEAGSSARGARYNSAIRYVTSSRYTSLAVVVSEDGGIDFFPDLKPMVKRSEIENSIALLKSFLDEESINHRRYNVVIQWLSGHRFYLLPQHCREVNEFMKLIDEKMVEEDPMAVRIVRNEFVPDPGLDTNLYYEPE